jgi:hypothetical protein
MNFLGNIQYNFDFIINLVLGLAVLAPYFFIVTRFTYSILAKSVLLYGGFVYILPAYIVQGWAFHRVGFDHLIVSYIFMLEFFILFKIFTLKLKKSDANDYVFKSFNQRNLNVIFIITLIILIIWIIYFLVNPHYSALYLYLSDTSSADSIRFVFYETPYYIQLIYAFTGRVVIPLGIIIIGLSKKNNKLSIIFLLSVFVLLHSGERQNILIMSFCMLLLFVLAPKISILYKFTFSALILMILFFVFSMQGNIEKGSEDYFLIFQILFNRIIVDPFYMFSYIFETYDENLMYGGTNKIFGFLGTDTTGWTAIGILPDAWINYGFIGIFTAPLLYSILLSRAVYFSSIVKMNRGMFFICNLLFFISFISLYYSNLFSLIPMFVYVLACLISVITRYYDNKRKIILSRVIGVNK